MMKLRTDARAGRRIGTWWLAACLAVSGCGPTPPAPQSPARTDTASAPLQPPSHREVALQGVRFVEVPPGGFVMGSPDDEPGHEREERQRRVAIPTAFWLSATEVTQKQWRELMGGVPSALVGDDLPVTRVGWDDAMRFCEELGRRCPGRRFALPTEEQWEYACRAGSALPFAPADGQEKELRLALEKCRSGDAEFLIRHLRRSMCFDQPQASPVGGLRPNAWGLYDMEGNVWEWCAGADPANPYLRPIRGGAYSSPGPFACRAALRGWEPRDARRDSIGFRVLAEP